MVVARICAEGAKSGTQVVYGMFEVHGEGFKDVSLVDVLARRTPHGISSSLINEIRITSIIAAVAAP